MNYVMVLITLGANPQPVTVGPFDTLMGCERAAGQVETLHARIRTTCLHLKARPHTWKDGKEIPK